MQKTSILTATKANGDIGIVDFPSNKAREIQDRILELKKYGYYRFKVEHGYPTYCTCGVKTGVSEVEHSTITCCMCKRHYN